MASWHYTVNDVKSPAFTPMPNLSKLGSSHGVVQIYGQPGTRGVPSPKPEALRPPCQGEKRPSMVSPDVIFPALYWVKTLVTSPYKVVNRRSTHEVPVPARKAYVTPIPLAKRSKMGGDTAMAWPSAPQYWGTNKSVNPGV
jgi:hypothetical protein